MTDLSALIERVEGGAGSDRELDGKVVRALSGSKDHWFPFSDGFMTEHTAPELTGSLDAVLSLIEAKLPGRSVDIMREAINATSRRFHLHMCFETPETAKFLPRAALSAALRAIQESRNDR